MWLCIIIYVYPFSTFCKCSRCRWDFRTTSGLRASSGTIAALVRWSASLCCCSRSGATCRGHPSRLGRKTKTALEDREKLVIYENRYLYSITHPRLTVGMRTSSRMTRATTTTIIFYYFGNTTIRGAPPVVVNDMRLMPVVRQHESVRRSPNKGII